VIRHRIAVIPGDGIGKEVTPEGIRVLDAAGRRFGIAFDWNHLDWSCETYKQTGRMMPADGLTRIARHDTIFLGAVGFPGVPYHISHWGLLIPIRRQFRQYVNLRPVRLLQGQWSQYRSLDGYITSTGWLHALPVFDFAPFAVSDCTMSGASRHRQRRRRTIQNKQSQQLSRGRRVRDCRRSQN
jgi:hypothetical protein